MRLPGAGLQHPVFKASSEGGLGRAAGVQAKRRWEARLLGRIEFAHLLGGLPQAMQVKNAHLAEIAAIGGGLDQEIGAPAAQSIPHRGGRGDVGGGPIRITQVGHHAAKTGEFGGLEFNRGFEPVVRIDVDHQAALVELALVIKGHLVGEGEITGMIQQQGVGVIVAEAVITALPEIGARVGGEGHRLGGNAVRFGGIKPTGG